MEDMAGIGSLSDSKLTHLDIRQVETKSENIRVLTLSDLALLLYGKLTNG